MVKRQFFFFFIAQKSAGNKTPIGKKRTKFPPILRNANRKLVRSLTFTKWETYLASVRNGIAFAYKAKYFAIGTDVSARLPRSKISIRIRQYRKNIRCKTFFMKRYLPPFSSYKVRCFPDLPFG